MKSAFTVTEAASYWRGGVGWVTEDFSAPSVLQMFVENHERRESLYMYFSEIRMIKKCHTQEKRKQADGSE